MMTAPCHGRHLLPLLLCGGLFLSGCGDGTGPGDAGPETIRGNVTLEELADLGAVGFIVVAEDYHFFAVPGQGETAITAIDPERFVAYGWSRTTPESNDRGFVLDLRTNTFETVQVPGVDRTIVRGADGRRRIVGLANVRSTSDSYGFVYDLATGQVTEVRRPGFSQGAVTDLNDAGVMVGYNDFGAVGYVLQDDAFTTLEAPGAGRLFPIEINEAGTIVGLWGEPENWWDVSRGFIATRSGSGFSVQAYQIPGGHLTTLNGVNDDGMLAGTYYPEGIEGLPRVFTATGPSATPRTHPTPDANLEPWVDGLDNLGRIFGHVIIRHVPNNPEECGGHGHLHGTECHCDSGYKQDPADPGMCIPA
jgi:hypothetical protein